MKDNLINILEFLIKVLLCVVAIPMIIGAIIIALITSGLLYVLAVIGTFLLGFIPIAIILAIDPIKNIPLFVGCCVFFVIFLTGSFIVDAFKWLFKKAFKKTTIIKSEETIEETIEEDKKETGCE